MAYREHDFDFFLITGAIPALPRNRDFNGKLSIEVVSPGYAAQLKQPVQTQLRRCRPTNRF